MHATIGAAAKPPTVKHRTITLTNRAPIRIVEDDWPILAQGQYGQSTWWEGDEYGHLIQIILRRRKDYADQEKRRQGIYIDEILHAKYEYHLPARNTDFSDADNSLTIRVGRLLAWDTVIQDGRMECQSVNDLWRHIRDVGEELRERIMNQDHKKQVTLAVDGVFANLSPHEVK